MAVTESLKKVYVRTLLNNGVDSDGNVVTVNGSLGSTISTSAFIDDTAGSNQKVMNIVSALDAVLSKEVYSVDKSITTSLTSA